VRIVFIRSGPLNMTPAIERHVSFLRDAGFQGECLGLELDFQPNRLPVTFVDRLESLSASYRTTPQRLWMMARWQLFQLRRLLAARPDVVQFCDVFSAVPALVVKWLRGARLVYDVRDPAALSTSHWGRLVSGLLGWVESFAAARSDVVVMVSEPLRELLPPGTQARTVVIPNAPPVDTFRGMRFSSDEKLRVSFAGFISHRRNLEAWCAAAAGDPSIVLDLFGAVYEDQTREILARYGLPEPKSIPLAAATQRILDADVVSIVYDPSIVVNQYTAPNKYFDALMLGKPILCARGLLLEREVEEAGCGISVRYGDPADLARALETLRDIDHRRAMGNAARRLFERRYRGLATRSREEVYRRAGVLPAG